MGEGKFYWLRLKEDFFKRHDIECLENGPNGAEIVLFYLKLMVESIDHEGRLRFNDEVPYTREMLATITHTDIDIVEQAFELLYEYKLLECFEDKTLFLPKVPDLIGYETKWAEKKRVQRAQKDKKGTMSPKCPPRVPHVSQNVRQEKEIEKEIEIEIENKSNEISFAYKNSDDEKTQIVENSVENSPTIQDVQEYILASGRQVNVNHIWESTKGMQEYRGQRVYDWKGLVDSWAETQISIPYKF